MTKTVRIENADTAGWPVRVTVQDKVFVDGKWTGEWRNATVAQIDQPTAMFSGYLTSSRRMLVEELGPDQQHEPVGA